MKKTLLLFMSVLVLYSANAFSESCYEGALIQSRYYIRVTALEQRHQEYSCVEFDGTINGVNIVYELFPEVQPNWKRRVFEVSDTASIYNCTRSTCARLYNTMWYQTLRIGDRIVRDVTKYRIEGKSYIKSFVIYVLR